MKIAFISAGIHEDAMIFHPMLARLKDIMTNAGDSLDMFNLRKGDPIAIGNKVKTGYDAILTSDHDSKFWLNFMGVVGKNKPLAFVSHDNFNIMDDITHYYEKTPDVYFAQTKPHLKPIVAIRAPKKIIPIGYLKSEMLFDPKTAEDAKKKFKEITGRELDASERDKCVLIRRSVGRYWNWKITGELHYINHVEIAKYFINKGYDVFIKSWPGTIKEYTHEKYHFLPEMQDARGLCMLSMMCSTMITNMSGLYVDGVNLGMLPILVESELTNKNRITITGRSGSGVESIRIKSADGGFVQHHDVKAVVGTLPTTMKFPGPDRSFDAIMKLDRDALINDLKEFWCIPYTRPPSRVIHEGLKAMINERQGK